MEQNQKSESVSELFNKVQRQLKRTLQSQDPLSAHQALGLAEIAMARIEGLILADPALTDDDLRCVVEFTHGKIWTEARRHLSTLTRARLPRVAQFAERGSQS